MDADRRAVIGPACRDTKFLCGQYCSFTEISRTLAALLPSFRVKCGYSSFHSLDQSLDGTGRNRPASGASRREGKGHAGKRELTTELLAREASFRLIVSGKVAVKEIERLIRKLEIDKEILVDQEGEEVAN
jgi:hypothetical protein